LECKIGLKPEIKQKDFTAADVALIDENLWALIARNSGDN
jgi:glycerophosphoryl diester phosphodiesterase